MALIGDGGLTVQNITDVNRPTLNITEAPITASQTVTSTSFITTRLVDTTSGAITLNFNTSYVGQIFIIKKIAGVLPLIITIDNTVSTINLLLNYIITTINETVMLQVVGTSNTIAIAKHLP